MSLIDGIASIGWSMAEMLTFGIVKSPLTQRAKKAQRLSKRLAQIRAYNERLAATSYDSYVMGEPQVVQPTGFCGVCGGVRYSLPGWNYTSRVVISSTTQCQGCLSWMSGHD